MAAKGSTKKKPTTKRMTKGESLGLPATTLLTVKEVANMLRVSRQTVYNLIETKQIPSHKIGRSYRVDALVLRAYLARVT